MFIEEIIAKIRTLQNCIVLPPRGLPRTKKDHMLTDEIVRFYELCGGVTLFKDALYSVEILPPDEVRQATPVFWDTDIMEAAQKSIEFEVSSGWYVIVDLVLHPAGT